MRSPFFWQNAGLVLVIAANLTLSVWLITRSTVVLPSRSDTPAPLSQSDSASAKATPSVLSVFFRALSVMYATASGLVLFFAVIQFLDAEFSEQSQAIWKRRDQWKLIQPGMTKTNVLNILGSPAETFVWYDLDRNDYKLDALDLSNGASVSFSIVPVGGTSEAKLVEKRPSDSEIDATNRDWFSYLRYSRYDTLKNRFVDNNMAFSIIGLMILMVLSLLPVWKIADYQALPLYFPAVALVFLLCHEHGQKGGWRCDVILLIPIYACIFGAWILRMYQFVWKS